jgi:tRNA nucleotidyltransferase (CCA-adding enzyme)
VSAGLATDITALLPDAQREAVALLTEAADDANVTLYWVGGPVRDALLGRSVTDIDLLVAGAGDQPMGVLQKLARSVVGADAPLRENARFFTLSFVVDDLRVDVAALRNEHYEGMGALPKVEVGTLEQDLLRRDFTVNALAVPLISTEADGEESIADSVIDLVEGCADLEARTLRVLHPRSFHDDPTRALRAARFAARLEFKLARTTRTQLRDAIRDGAFGGVSGDRLRREFEKLFAETAKGVDPAAALKRLDDWHVLGALEPGLELRREARAPLRRLGQALADPPWRPRNHRPWVSGLCVWLRPLGPALRKRSVQRLSVRGEVAERIVNFDRTLRRATKSLEGTRGRGAADRVLSTLDEDQLFAFYASCSAPLRRRVIRWAAEDRERRLPITGRDLSAAGFEGPLLGDALARVRAAYLDGEVANREEAMALAREIARRGRARKR